MSGSLIQSRFGFRGNFEVVATGVTSGIAHYWRNNDDPALPWSGPTRFGGSTGFQATNLIQSNFGTPGNLEVVAVAANNQLVHFWRDSGPSFTWHGPIFIASGVIGGPGFIQSRFGNMGNFEVVVPSVSGGLLHFFRNNDAPGLPWSGPTHFAESLGGVSGVSLIQSNFGSPGNLEVVASTVNGPVYHLWRDSGPSFTWHISGVIPGAFGGPSLIQGRFGFRGNFELVLNTGDGMVHFWRNNDAPGLPWSGPTAFAKGWGFGFPSLIQSNFGGSPGNLEVIAETPQGKGLNLAHLWRDPAFLWNGPVIVATGV